MKVLLVKPNLLRGGESEGHFSSLLPGLLSIAAYVDDPDRLRVALHPDDAGSIEESAAWADAIGFSAFTFEYEYVRRLARDLRERFPGKLFFIGGYHVTLLGRCDESLFDFMVSGEGEKPVRALVNDLVVPPRDGTKGMEGKFGRVAAKAPLPAAEIPLVDYRFYPRASAMPGNRAGLLTSRGCSFAACRFCTSSRFHRGLRRIPVERAIVQAERAIRQLGSPRVSLWDDNMSDAPGYLDRLTEGLAERGIALKETSCFVRTTSPMKESAFDSFRRAGVTDLISGFESGSDRVLKYLKGPRADVEVNRGNCLAARDAGLRVQGSVMIGVPGESLDEMRETLRFLEWKRDQRVEGTVRLNVATPLPGCELWEIGLERGVVSEEMDFETLDFERFDRPLLLDPGISRGEFARIVEEALALIAEIDAMSMSTTKTKTMTGSAA